MVETFAFSDLPMEGSSGWTLALMDALKNEGEGQSNLTARIKESSLESR
jgi:hypothetical protein